MNESVGFITALLAISVVLNVILLRPLWRRISLLDFNEPLPPVYVGASPCEHGDVTFVLSFYVMELEAEMRGEISLEDNFILGVTEAGELCWADNTAYRIAACQSTADRSVLRRLWRDHLEHPQIPEAC